jgi:flagellar operon protein (TIGR03826 family)
MKIRQCSQCKGIFQSFGEETVCPRCMEEMDQQYVKVRDYLYEHPRAGIVELSKETQVDEKMILRFLKEERLILAEPTEYLRCASCGTPISSGRYCENCLKSIKNEIDRLIPDDDGKKKKRNMGYAQIIQYNDEDQ